MLVVETIARIRGGWALRGKTIEILPIVDAKGRLAGASPVTLDRGGNFRCFSAHPGAMCDIMDIAADAAPCGALSHEVCLVQRHTVER